MSVPFRVRTDDEKAEAGPNLPRKAGPLSCPRSGSRLIFATRPSAVPDRLRFLPLLRNHRSEVGFVVLSLGFGRHKARKTVVAQIVERRAQKAAHGRGSVDAGNGRSPLEN